MTKLADISENVSYGYTESASIEKVGPRFLRITDIQGGIVNWNTVPFCPISEADHEKYRLKHGDIVIARTGNSTGENFLYRGDEDAVFASYLIRFRIDREKANPAFVWYNLRSKQWWNFINSSKSGSAQAGANAKVLGQFSLLLPPLSEQQAIASVLGALDDKIELNRRMNETLEAMAQTLFKSWFIDLTVNSLPKGWRESTIGEEVRVVGGSTPSTSKPEFWDGGSHHWATPKDLANLSSPVLLDTERKITDAGLQQISSGLLPAGTVLMSSRAPIGYLAILEVPIAVNQGFIALVCDKSLPNYFVHLWLKNNMEAIKVRANGTTFMEISKGNFRSMKVFVPPQALLDEFQNKVDPLHRRIVSNFKESRALAALRDTLLPKLLSGELRLPSHGFGTTSVPQAKQPTASIIPLFDLESVKSTRKTSDEFVEAVVIAQFTRHLCTSKITLLGRKRYNKFSYLAHRKAKDDVREHYLKKAAGPYSPWARYEGPERIALKNGYIKNAKAGEMVGFAPGEKIAEIDRYLHYPICAAVDWAVNQFRFRTNDDMELLATVDFAALDLLENKKPVSLETVRNLIATNKEWAAKLKREIFSEANIARALTELWSIFPKTYAEASA